MIGHLIYLVFKLNLLLDEKINRLYLKLMFVNKLTLFTYS